MKKKESFKALLHIRVTPDIQRKLQAIADLQGASVSQVVRVLVRDWIAVLEGRLAVSNSVSFSKFPSGIRGHQ